MTAGELIKELQRVSPDTPVRIATEKGSCDISGVSRMGYSDMKFTIISDDV